MSVTIDRALVEHIALLSRLSLEDAEAEAMTEHLRRIVELVSSLDQLDTAAVSPFGAVVEQRGVFREDEPRPSLSAAEAIANAPGREAAAPGEPSAFRVPPVLE